MKLIAAADKNWAIGKNNSLLVRIPNDMRFFKMKTSGNVVVMGRKTLESFPGGLPLPNRTNIVLTSQKDYKVKNAIIVHDMAELKEELSKYDTDRIFVIGGGSIYHALYEYCDEAFITRLDYSYDADTFMPDLDALPNWHLVEEGEEETIFDLIYYFTRYENDDVKEL